MSPGGATNNTPQTTSRREERSYVGGYELYRRVRTSRVAAASLPRAERKKLFDHTLRSVEDANRIVDQLEREEP